MKKLIPFTFVALMGLAPLARPAAAQLPSPEPRQTGIGVGVATMLNGPAGLGVVYDAGRFHIDGIFGIYDPARPYNTEVGAAVRGWFHLHSRASSDFSVGGGVGFDHLSSRDGATTVNFDVGAQIRAFLVSNVAFNAGLGFGISTGDQARDNWFLGGHLVGDLGLIYFFY